jgi:peptide/nickel transport system substrate-binding protein
MHRLITIGLLLLGTAWASPLTVAISSNPNTLDPQITFNGFAFFVTNQIYETLVRVSPEGKIVPGLATSWSYPDTATLRLTLREGVTFHDGTPLNAEAVKASLNRLLDPATRATGRFVVSAISAVTVVDELTVDVVTNAPFAPLLSHLSHPVTAIVPVQHAPTLGRNPVGTGPYTFVEWQDGTSVTLRANAAYWGGVPAIADVVIRIIPEVGTQIIELRSGGVDIIFNLPPDNFKALEQAAGITTGSFLGWGSAHLGINTAHPKLSDPRVRQAIALAIDKTSIVTDLLQGLALPAVAPIPPTVRFAVELPEPYPYDPDRAKALLAEAGASNLTLRLDIYQNPDLEAMAQALQFLFGEVGIELSIRVQEYPAFVEAGVRLNFGGTPLGARHGSSLAAV